VVLEGGELDGKIELTLGAWDMIILPPNTFHEATNIGDSDAWLISINPGKDGRPYTIHPDVIAELRALSEDAGKAAAIGADI
jgi:oxalate decarboxylase/phosphoglucose isomerase-like protein (cupin superfamily)